MTDRIDLDELDEPDDGPTDGPNRGDWLWREEGDPDDEPAPSPDSPGEQRPGADPDKGADAGPNAGDGEDEGSERRDDPTDRPIPHVPRANKDRPVGIPVEAGGAGGGSGRDGTGGGASPSEGTDDPAGVEEEPPPPEDASTAAASGPHGGGVDDMTVAFTYRAVTRLSDPAAVVADASGWADWIGVVGDVEAHVVNKFQRDHGVDVDFFNGTGTGPGERLSEIDEHSMFFAERMVVVGVEGEDEPVAGAAGWEFVPLSTAAEKAGWELSG